jgi:endonuclease-3
MSLRRPKLNQVLRNLKAFHGKPPRLVATDPFALAVLESCAYLVDDDRRHSVFLALKKKTKLSPMVLRTAPADDLLDLIKPGGMLPEMRLEKLRTCAEIALDVGPETLRHLGEMPIKEARKLLKRFPGIANAGADKILLFSRVQPSLAPDSNSLRVLIRLGFGTESPDYSKKYHSAAEAVAPELPNDFDWLIEAHQLLRLHGKQICKASAPRCGSCPLTRQCAWFQASA